MTEINLANAGATRQYIKSWVYCILCSWGIQEGQTETQGAQQGLRQLGQGTPAGRSFRRSGTAAVTGGGQFASRIILLNEALLQPRKEPSLGVVRCHRADMQREWFGHIRRGWFGIGAPHTTTCLLISSMHSPHHFWRQSLKGPGNLEGILSVISLPIFPVSTLILKGIWESYF